MKKREIITKRLRLAKYPWIEVFNSMPPPRVRKSNSLGCILRRIAVNIPIETVQNTELPTPITRWYMVHSKKSTIRNGTKYKEVVTEHIKEAPTIETTDHRAVIVNQVVGNYGFQTASSKYVSLRIDNNYIFTEDNQSLMLVSIYDLNNGKLAGVEWVPLFPYSLELIFKSGNPITQDEYIKHKWICKPLWRYPDGREVPFEETQRLRKT